MNEKIIRTTKGLQEALFEEIDRLRNGETTPAAARCTALLGNAIIHTARLELDLGCKTVQLGDGE